MVGLGFQELLVILILLVLFLVVQPTATYLTASLFLKGFRLSPRRSLLAFWLLVVADAALMYASDKDLNLFIGTVILGPVGIALNLGWLWLMGSIWRMIPARVAIRVGTAWRNTAVRLWSLAR